MSPTIRAVIACVFFAAVGMWALHINQPSDIELLLAGYYAVLILNTFFSIRTISAFTPNNAIQMLFDTVLVLTYCALAFSLGSVAQFSAVSLFLFIFADGKYAHLRRLVAHKQFLWHKMQMNALGAALSLGALITAALGYPLSAAWFLFVAYALANVYLLGINPMYRL